MGGFFSIEHHPIYDDRDIEGLKRFLERFGIVREEKISSVAIKDTSTPKLVRG